MGSNGHLITLWLPSGTGKEWVAGISQNSQHATGNGDTIPFVRNANNQEQWVFRSIYNYPRMLERYTHKTALQPKGNQGVLVII